MKILSIFISFLFVGCVTKSEIRPKPILYNKLNLIYFCLEETPDKSIEKRIYVNNESGRKYWAVRVNNNVIIRILNSKE